ncbi:MAG TPA: thiamine pyrophosphate-dependent enzyme [Candidatus Paceibacterota bacterium]|nr:thiamine pyrophosphate-dependent enzyme [Candidatus Paceibacterota bacterium]
MEQLNLSSSAKITWCPGCPNSQILVAYRQLVTEMVNAGEMKLENLVSVAGIGCHGKITDYLQTNTYTSLHGRLIPSMTGIKLANPGLTVVGFSGDGDSFDEGMEHLVHVARRNSDVNLFIHDNQVFALTTGQATPLSPKGFKGRSTPAGTVEEPLNPLLTMLAVGATFVARTFAQDIAGTKRIMKAAIAHKGFSFVDIIQPCITFYDTRDFYKEHVYWIPEDFPKTDRAAAIAKVTEGGDRTPLGIFYDVSKPTFEDEVHG